MQVEVVMERIVGHDGSQQASYHAGGQPGGRERADGEAPWRGLDACLGLYASGGDRVGQCGVVAFVLVGVGLGEVGYGLVEFV